MNIFINKGKEQLKKFWSNLREAKCYWQLMAMAEAHMDKNKNVSELTLGK